MSNVSENTPTRNTTFRGRNAGVHLYSLYSLEKKYNITIFKKTLSQLIYWNFLNSIIFHVIEIYSSKSLPKQICKTGSRMLPVCPSDEH